MCFGLELCGAKRMAAADWLLSCVALSEGLISVGRCQRGEVRLVLRGDSIMKPALGIHEERLLGQWPGLCPGLCLAVPVSCVHCVPVFQATVV